MAKQAGPFYITGCCDNICFYRMGGAYYARMKSSLDGKRVKKDPAFKETMRYAHLLGQASKLASAVYRELTKEQKEKGLYRKLTGKAMRLLRDGMNAADAVFVLKLPYFKIDNTTRFKEQELITPVFKEL